MQTRASCGRGCGSSAGPHDRQAAKVRRKKGSSPGTMTPMGDHDSKSKATVPVDTTVGNALFEKAVVAIGLDRGTTRWLFVSVLHAIGADPSTLTAEELGN